ncbi:hypothetical protein RQP46_007927 [Phenoliferia psychrophenolica]
MLAWRFSAGSTSAAKEGHDDGGEAAAGRKLLRLLEIVEAEDVLLVVTRWHGGVQLGPDRFRLITAVRRLSLICG